MKAFVFLEGDLEFAIESDEEKYIDKYMDAFRHGAGFYAGHGVQYVIQDGELFMWPDDIRPVPDKLVSQIRSDRGSKIRVLKVGA